MRNEVLVLFKDLRSRITFQRWALFLIKATFEDFGDAFQRSRLRVAFNISVAVFMIRRDFLKIKRSIF